MIHVYRSAPAELQEAIAERIVKKVSMPNLLLDPDVTWECDVSLIPRLNTTPRGCQTFQFNDTATIRHLGLPIIPSDEPDHLLILGTGPYVLHRSNVTLTATREYELRGQRASGLTGSITDYNTMATMLPQVTPVYYFYQNERPAGYSEEKYGVWPEGSSLVLKCQFASTHKSPGTRSNMSTVTMVIAAHQLPDNPLLLTGPLNRLLSYACTCGSGAGTNRACAHVCAFVRGLMSPETVRSAKRNVGLRTDIHAPAEHQPTQTGPPSVGRDRNILFNPAPAPQPRTAARRANSRWCQPTPGDQRRPPIFTGQTQTHHTPGHAQQPQGQPEGARPQGQYQGAQPQGAQSQEGLREPSYKASHREPSHKASLREPSLKASLREPSHMASPREPSNMVIHKEPSSMVIPTSHMARDTRHSHNLTTSHTMAGNNQTPLKCHRFCHSKTEQILATPVLSPRGCMSLILSPTCSQETHPLRII